jgi:putative phosphoesterase
MKVCIVSDSHDRAPPLAAAVADAKAQGALMVLHCGDVIGAQTLRPLLGAGLPIHVIHGNNLGDAMAMGRLAAESGGLLRYHGADAQLELAGRRVFVVHYPHYGRAFAATGEWDVVCCGHSHQAEVVRAPNLAGRDVWLVNPGTVAGVGGPATYVLGDLASMRFDVRPAPN